MRFMKMQERRNSIKQHKYLLQMISTCVTLIMLPFIISLIILCKQSYSELLNTYQTYYMESTEKFASQFSSQINEMYSDSFIIAADSRNSKKATIGLDLNKIREHSYYLYSATTIVSDYSQSMPQLMGIYYYEIDRLVTNRAAWSARQYWQDHLHLPKQDISTNESYLKFFSDEGNPLVFFVPPNQNTMYVGIRTKLGTSRTDALFIYNFSSLLIDTSLLLSENLNDTQYLILDESHNTLLSLGTEYTNNFDLGTVLEGHWQDGKFSLIKTIDSTTYIISTYYDTLLDFTYLIMLPLNQATANLSVFYSSLLRTLLITGIVMLIAIGLLIFVNYRPILRLLRKLSHRSKDLNEFDAISDELNRMANEISEQSMVIVDSLLGNILYGIPLSEEMMCRIGIPANYHYFFVFTLSNGSINTTQSDQITGELFQQFATQTYITNILFQDLTVVICMSTEDHKSQIFDYLNEYLYSNVSPESQLRRGETVSSVNEIKRSFDSNFTISNKQLCSFSPQESIEQDQTIQLMQQIIVYIDRNFADPMFNQASVADHFQISTYSLSRLFKSKTNINFTEYITNKRMQLAQELLQDGNSVASIVSQVGISNVNYFYKVFKTFTGITPAKYAEGYAKEK